MDKASSSRASTSNDVCLLKKRKRHYSSDPNDDGGSSSDDNKPATKIFFEEHQFCLTTLCDELLIEILLNLDIKSLLAVGLTCNRLQLLICDNRLWKYVDLTKEQLNLNDITERLQRVHDHTISIKIRGMVEEFPLETWKNVSLDDKVLQHITETCENLQTLELHHCFINTETIDVTHFPKKLKTLVFNDCYVRWPNTPPILFTRIDNHLKDLQELRIEFCNWFSTHDLVSFSKIQNLKKLSIRGCNDLKEFVPYGSIAARCGFKELEFLDLRETPITDSDLQCFNILQNLKELLIECPPELRLRLPNTPNETGERNHNESRPELRRVEPDRNPRPPNALRPGRFFIVNFLVNNQDGINIENPEPQQQPDRNAAGAPPGILMADRNGYGGPNMGAIMEEPDLNRFVPRVQENHPMYRMRLLREQEQLELALRAYLPRRGEQNMRHAASIYFAPAKITDRAICSFGTARIPVQQNIICIRAEPRPMDTSIERLTIRHYRYVTDISLQHLVQCSPKLKFLDITGSGVSEAGVTFFKTEKPECYIVSDHFTG